MVVIFVFSLYSTNVIFSVLYIFDLVDDLLERIIQILSVFMYECVWMDYEINWGHRQ